MVNQRKLEQDKAKADRYAHWFEQDGLKDALTAIKQAYINSLIHSQVGDKAGRENCYIAIGVVDHIEGHIRSIIGGGKMATKTLEKIEKEQTTSKIFNLF